MSSGVAMPEVVGRERYHDAAAALEQLVGVRAVDVFAEGGQLDRPCLEVVVGPGYERVPPRVLRVVAAHDMGIRPDLSGGQGRPPHWVLVVV